MPTQEEKDKAEREQRERNIPTQPGGQNQPPTPEPTPPPPTPPGPTPPEPAPQPAPPQPAPTDPDDKPAQQP